MGRKLNKEEELEKLEEFIFYIDDLLDDIIEKARSQDFSLDLSTESLKTLSQFIKKNEIKNDKENMADFINCWVYLGEVFRRQAEGAVWTVGLDNPKNVNYGLYYLTGYDKVGSEFIPILYLNNFVSDTEGRLGNDFLYSLIDKHLHPKPVNLDYLPTEE